MDDPLLRNPYKTLNVPKDATLATIRSAHRKLVLSCHPDKVLDESAKKQKAEQFHQVQQAYEILSDENRRQRYDEKVKLAELRAEMAEERGSFPSRRPYEYPSSRNGSTSKFEVRGGAVYETREPAGSRYDEPDVFAGAYAEVRPSTSRKYTDDRYTTSTRKTSGSGRMQEERKKPRAYEEEEDDRRRRERRERDAERAAEAMQRDQRTRRREKDRRRDGEWKSRGKFESHVEDDVSDSEVEDRYYSKSKRDSPPKKRSGDESKKRSGDERKRSEDERRKDRDDPWRSSKREVKEYDELERKESVARDYINRSRDAVETLPRHPELRNRAASSLDPRTVPPPLSVEKRPSGRRSDSRAVSPMGRSGKDRRSPEIMEPRRPSIPGHSSESSKKKSYFGVSSSSKREPHRSATYQTSTEVKHPSMRRSETMPVDRMRPGNPVPLKSSNLKNMKAPSDTSDSSSESDSEMTEENHPPSRPTPLQRKTTFGISQEGAYVREPEPFQPHPKESRRTSERPSMGPRTGSTRSPPMVRAMSSAFPSDERRPSLGRHESARGTPLKTRDSGRGGELFGEYSPHSPTENTFRRSPKTSGDDERRPYNPKQYPGRGSEEVYRDDYPGSHRSRMGRSESQQVRV
ncbi:MAG: hypothetical protein Q9175_005916 [Cornicularia normoerica]